MGYGVDDHVFFHHEKLGPKSGRVICHGLDGCTVEDEAKGRHQVHWHRVLGLKSRPSYPATIVDRGTGGAILERQDGRRMFVAGELPIAEMPSNTPLSGLHDRARMAKALQFSKLDAMVGSLKARGALVAPDRAMPLMRRSVPALLKATGPHHGNDSHDERGRFSRKWSVSRSAKTFAEAREAAKAYQGQPMINVATGVVATVSRNSLDKMLSRKAVTKSESPEIHAFAVANLDQIYKRSILGWSKPDANGSHSIAAIHRFFAAVVKDGTAYMSKMTVKETARPDQPNPLYTVESVEFNEKSPAAWWVDSTVQSDEIDPTSIRSAGDVMILAQQVEKFNSAHHAL